VYSYDLKGSASDGRQESNACLGDSSTVKYWSTREVRRVTPWRADENEGRD
jgi:hypothetical protein